MKHIKRDKLTLGQLVALVIALHFVTSVLLMMFIPTRVKAAQAAPSLESTGMAMQALPANQPLEICIFVSRVPAANYATNAGWKFRSEKDGLMFVPNSMVFAGRLSGKIPSPGDEFVVLPGNRLAPISFVESAGTIPAEVTSGK